MAESPDHPAIGLVGSRIAGFACLILASSIWGGMYVVSKYALAFIPPMTLLFFRLLIGGAALVGAMVAVGAPWVRRTDLPGMALLGLVGFGISLGSQFLGTRMSSAAHGAVITAITPACIVVLAAGILKERVSWRTALGVGLATVGVLLVVDAPADPSFTARVLWGDLLLALAGITWALYTVLSRRAADRYPAITITTYATLFGILIVLPAVPLELAGYAWPALPALVGWAVLYLGVVSTALAFYLWNTGFTLVSSAAGSLCFFAQPIVGATLGWLLLGEVLGVRFWSGALLVIGGGILARERN